MADQTQDNNYYSGQNTSPGFTPGNNTVPGQQGGVPVTQGGQNVIQQLMQYLQSPAAGGQQQGGMSVGAPQGINPVTGLGDTHIDVLRKVVNKGIQRQAEQFYQQNPKGAEALITHHDMTMGTQPGGQVQPAAIGQSTTAQPAPGQTASPASPAPVGGSEIQPSAGNQAMQQQAAGLVARPTNIIQALLQGINQGTGQTGVALDNLSKAQGINWGTPEGKGQLSQAANMNAQTEMQNLTNKGMKPIDPEQYLTAYSGMYQKVYDAYGKDEETGNQITQSALDAYNKLADTSRNALQKGLGTVNPQMKAALQSASASLKASIDARSNFYNFMANNSPAQVIGAVKNKINQNTSSGPASNAQAVTQMLQPGEAKNINGNMIKRLK